MNAKQICKGILIGLLLLMGHVASAAIYSDSNDNLDLPFKATTLIGDNFAPGTQWYKIQVSGGKYWAAQKEAVTCSVVSDGFSDDNYFCFVGDNTDGFQLYNKSLGTGYLICCASDTSHEPLLPVQKASAPTPCTLKLSVNADGYNFYYPGNQTACINDLHGDGVLTLWTSSAAPSGSGCRMYIEAVDSETIAPEQESGVPFLCTRIVNGEFAPYTRWYTMNIRSGKLLKATDERILCAPTDTVTASHLWCFTGSKAEGYTVYNYAYGTNHVAHVASASDEELVKMVQASTSDGGTSVFQISQNSSGGVNLHFPDVPNSCWNDYGVNGYIALWNSANASSDGGSNILFNQYDASLLPQEPIVDSTAWMSVDGEIVYICLKDGRVHAFPREYLLLQTTSNGILSLLTKNGAKYTYNEDDIDSLTTHVPAELPRMLSFKFNNKFNDMLMVDAFGEFTDSAHISVIVGSIGKRLVASIKTSQEEAEVYIVDSLQDSKYTSRRFESPVTYTVARPGWRMLRRNAITGAYGMHPFGNDYQVSVKYLSDAPTTEYGVPAIYITTDDGSMISSKTTYLSAKIKIDGAGYLPDMEEMPMQIKGRGNSSWAGTWGKSPYRIKFATKQKPLGMKAGKNWNLIANKQKGSMTTNVIGSRVAEMVGAAAANHFLPVELYINGGYRGSYNLTEKVGFSNNSIDLLDETNAALLELDTYYDETYKFTTTQYSVPVNVKYPDFSSDVTNLTLSVVSKHFNTLTNNVLRMRPVSEYADPVYLARYLMVNDLIFNLELTHPKSMFVYNENILSDSTRYIFGPVWDCDWGFGYQSSQNYFIADAETDYYDAPAAQSTGKRFLKALRYNGGNELNKQYYRVWTDFMQNHLDDLLEYLDDYYALAKKSFEHDNTMWSCGGSAAYADITKQSKEWLRKRAEYVYDYLSNTLGYADKGYLEPDIPDAIDIVRHEPATKSVQGVYDLTGRRVGDTLDHLPSGIYIQNGRKVMKK